METTSDKQRPKFHLRHEQGKTTWGGRYRGVGFEIQNWPNTGDVLDLPTGCWTHYLFLNLNQIPEENKPLSFWLRKKKTTVPGSSFTYYDYSKHPIISSVEFHGGCTWYSKESGFDGDDKVLRIGCDYSHSWDFGQHYSLSYVTAQVKQSIDSLHGLIPELRVRCPHIGGWHRESEGRYLASGEFISAAGDKYREEQGWPQLPSSIAA
jgi:hypothetical protein